MSQQQEQSAPASARTPPFFLGLAPRKSASGDRAGTNQDHHS
jgi:hypothetical protein